MSVIAPLPSELEAAYAAIALGAVLPIDHYPGDPSALRSLVQQGSLYLIARVKRRWCLVAVLEAPTHTNVRTTDPRAPGWYAPVNTTPVTDLHALRLGALDHPRRLTADEEARIRTLIDDEDAPLIASVETTGAPMTDLPAGMPALARATALLDAGHVTRAIDALLEAWRARRAVAIADLIDRATRLLPTHDRPLLATRYGDPESHRTWMAARANHAETMPQLLPNLEVLAGYRDEQIASLADLPIDPRVASGLVTRAHQIASDVGWRTLATVVLAARDARVAATLRDVETTSVEATRTGRGFTAEMFAFARNPGDDAALAEAERAALAAFERACHAREGARRTECELVDALAAHPDDPQACQVYADWLLERRHPRGEAIVLACRKTAGTLSPAEARRRAALDDIPNLYGALDQLAISHVRARPDGVDRALAVSWNVPGLVWREAAIQPLARAIEAVTMIGEPKPSVLVGLAAFARANPNLRTIEGISRETFAAMRADLGGAWVLARGADRIDYQSR